MTSWNSGAKQKPIWDFFVLAKAWVFQSSYQLSHGPNPNELAAAGVVSKVGLDHLARFFKSCFPHDQKLSIDIWNSKDKVVKWIIGYLNNHFQLAKIWVHIQLKEPFYKVDGLWSTSGFGRKNASDRYPKVAFSRAIPWTAHASIRSGALRGMWKNPIGSLEGRCHGMTCPRMLVSFLEDPFFVRKWKRWSELVLPFWGRGFPCGLQHIYIYISYIQA